jgi:hypothetical protein
VLENMSRQVEGRITRRRLELGMDFPKSFWCPPYYFPVSGVLSLLHFELSGGALAQMSHCPIESRLNELF